MLTFTRGVFEVSTDGRSSYFIDKALIKSLAPSWDISGRPRITT